MRASNSSSFLILAALLLGFDLTPAQAQLPAGFSDFFVLGQDEHVWNMMNRVRSGEGAALFPTPNRLNSVSAATATADGQRVTYDHWEDGMETDILVPVQTSTLVFGDSNNANGRVCDYSVDPRVFPCTGVASHDDVLYAGTPMSLDSDGGMAGTCAAPYAAPPSLAQVRCSFPISPVVASITQAAGTATVTVTDATGHSFANGSTVRIAGANEAAYNGSFTITTAGPASLTFTYAVPPATASLATGTITVSFPTIRFDGGDRVFSTGGSLSIAQVQDPGTPLIGGGTELIGRELVKDATVYSVPIGEDLYPGTNNVYFSVKYAAINVVAFDDNTSVTVTSPGGTGGGRSFVLHRGQHYASCTTFGLGVAGNVGTPGACLSGAIDGPPPPSGPDNRGVFPALALTINAGTKISTSGPLNVLIFTGGSGAYQTRHYATLPDILHTTDYVTTAPGDDPASQGVSALNLFIYNPNPTTSITVTATDTLGTTNIVVPAGSVSDYRNAVGRFLPPNSGVRLRSTRPFWGLSAYDSLGLVRDWGHAWLGVRFLQSDYSISYGPGTQVTQIVSYSRTASPGCVATINTGTAHVISNGSTVRIAGVSDNQFNGTFTVTSVPTATSLTYVVPACAGGAIALTPSTGTLLGLCDASAVPACNSYNRDPIWVAGTQNNTQVRVDLDADGLWDFIDTNSDNCPDNGDLAAAAGTCESNLLSVPPGCAALTANQCIYLVNGPGSASRNVLRVWDYTDLTNAGTRIVGSAPIALSWGQDTDQGQAGDPSPDNGYTVYPPIAIDLVLGIEKTVLPLRVALAGGAANYTVRIFAGDYGPLTFVLPRDTLPIGITCANYQPGSTVITYPDLTTSTADPVCAVLPGGRSQLTWAPVNSTLLVSEQMLINYTVNIPAAPGGLPRSLENEAQVTGLLGSSSFTPRDTAIVMQAELTITKSVADDGVPEVGDILTYTVSVTNGNVAPETNVVLTDILPPFTNYVPGSATISTSLVKAVTSITKPANPATTATVTFANLQGALALDLLTVSGATGGTIAYNGTFTPANLALTGITFAGALATATTATAHGWTAGDTIQIAGATDPLYNGRFTIAAAAGTTFQYTMSGTPAAPSPAGPTATQRSANKFSYTVPGATPSPATGVIIASGAGFDAGQNAVVWSGDTFAPLAVATVTFQVRITDSTPAGSIIPNTANYSSTQIPSQNSNTVQTTVIGPILSLVKAITSVRTVSVTSLSDGGTSTATATSAAHGFTVGQFVTIAGATATVPNNYNGTFLVATVPNANTFTYTESAASGSAAGGVITATTAVTPGSVLDYEVVLSNSGTGGAKAVGISDALAGSNTTYLPGTASFSVNGGPFTALTDAADVDRFFFSGTTLSFSYFRPVVSITRVGATATVTTSVPHLFVNGNSVTIAGADDNAYNGTFIIAGAAGNTFTYTVVGTPATPATGVLTAELNPTFSLAPGGTLRLRFKVRVDPGTVGLYATNQARAVATGQPITPSNLTQVPIVRPTVVSIAKTSSGAGIALPGQTLTYTVVVANDTGTTQTGITINDPLPPGTTYVPGSASVTTSLPVFRSTEYYVAPGAFTLATFQLTLNQALASNYFVITQGSDLNGGADSPPMRNYISLTGDPFGTGAGGAVAGLAVTGVANRIDFTRGAASLAGSSWSGVITVVECLNACATAGFTLRDVARIPHPLATVGPAAVVLDAAGQWTVGAALRIMLLGGFQGAGCDTAEATAGDTKGCHVRLFPTGSLGTSAVNWTRDATGAGLEASNSTVMVVEWGTEWTVNRQNIAGGNGGAGINAAGEYDNSAAFAAVARGRTWVWGTGHTDNNEQSNASEGVALTLGNGVVQNANETILSAGIFNAQTKSFEVYALTHPSLVVDHRFKPQNPGSDPVTATFDQTTSLGSGARMALSYMGVGMNNIAYPQSMFSARYLSPAQIRLERRRIGGSFAAWTQGVNFSNLNSTTAPVAPGHVPPGLVIPADGFTIPPGGSLTLTYQVLVDSPLLGTITQITNTATYTSTQILAPGISSTVIDTVTRPAVKVEPNNAGFVPFNAGTAQTILFTQGVTNTGTTADSFTLTLDNDILGWKLELIDPATGTVIATDTNGDGVWDGGVIISSGSLAVNQTKSYTIRATVPAATPIGTQSSVELTATSALAPTVKDVGTDEVTVLDVTKFGPVVLLPDHSGIVTAGQSIAYTHRIFNNTGSPEIFGLVVAGTGAGWTRTVHADTNADGVYTAGIDLAVANTATLPNGGAQILFVVVTAPVGATPGQNDFTDLTARSQTVPTQVDSVTDTTTILSATSHDLAGGGTRMVALGDTATYPGTLYNLTGAPDRFDIQIAATSLFGVDGLNHPTVLRVDTNADGLSDTTIAIDANGDGTWDSLCGSGAPPLPCLPGTFNFDGDAFPDVLVAGNGALNYELVRVIDPAQAIWKEYVTLSAISFSTSEIDAVTAQWIIAALSRASIRGLRVDLSGVVEFVTATQRGTKFFNLYETNERSRDGERTLLNASPILSPGPDSVVPILYRVETGPIKGRYLLIEETETSGTLLTYGPYSMTNTRLRRGLERVEAQMDAAEVPVGPVRLAHRNPARSSRAKVFRAERRIAARSASALARVARRSSSALRLDIEGAGVVRVPMTDLVNAGLPSWTPRSLSLTNLGRPVPFRIETRAHGSSLVFTATSLETDYSEVNPYVLAWGRTVLAPEVTLTRSSDPARPGYTRVERNSGYALAYVPDADPWAWDTLTGDGSTWPQGTWDPTAGEFDLPQLAVGARGAAPILIRLAGLTADKHDVMARINGMDVGRVTFTGVRTALLSGSVPVSVLRRAGNELTLTYSALNSDGALAPSGYVLLDYVDIGAPMSGPTTDPATIAGIEAYSPNLPGLARTQYLIVTHPLFKDQADRLAALKEADGLRATVVTVDTAYDRFSAGVPEPQAIAALIRKASANRRLKYVLLFGDDTFDPRNFLGGEETSFVPSIMGREGWGRIPNENAYADTNGDGRPDLAIGRLPVSTVEEAVIVVDKIAQQTPALQFSGNVHVFVSDDSREIDSRFDEEAAEMSQKLPASSTSVMADVGQGVGLARQTLFGSWGAGVTMTHYFGHGGPEIWTDEALFSVDDALPETMSPMVLFAWACQSQWYQNYFGPTINEALFLAPRSGSLASFGPVGTTSPSHQREIYERVYQDLYTEGLSLGEIIRRAKAAAVTANPSNQDAVDGFMFFGDPSLHVPRP